MKILSLLFFLYSSSLISQTIAGKIKGVNLVNPPKAIELDKMQEIKRINADWVSVIPYGFSYANEPNVSFDFDKQWWGEKTGGTCELINMGKQAGFKVMLKPHIWVIGEGWAGDYKVATEEEWKIWENDFSKYILHHAKVADSLQVDLFCIATEYRVPARNRPDFWRKLIKKVKSIYDGPLTYASNWDNFDQITWWDELDYIGVDAYFPLVEKHDPSTQEIIDGWQLKKEVLSSFSKQWSKKVIFTEFGFQSIHGACSNHWEVDKSLASVNYALQARAFDATFLSLMYEPWFLGGFVWKWHFQLENMRGLKTTWTPQNKPAEQVIAEWYAKIE